MPARTTHLLVGSLLLLSAATSAWAFDDDREISTIDFVPGNFLDVNAHAFRKPLELQWYEAINGFRVSGASLDADRLYVKSELKLEQHMSEEVFVRVEAEQEVLYGAKAFPNPRLEAGLYPFGGQVGISMHGTTHYDKRQSDLGLGLIFGRRPWDYLYLAWTKVDAFFNEKNGFDGSRYVEEGHELRLQGAYRLSTRARLHFRLDQERPLEFYDADEGETFTHEATRYDLAFDYLHAADEFVGIAARGFDIDKTVTDSAAETAQALSYHSIETYWVQPLAPQHELTLGLRYDGFGEQRRSPQDAGFDKDYDYRTWQTYGRWYYDYSTYSAWDIGLYAGWYERTQHYPASPMDNLDEGGVQGKLRIGWEYHSADKRSALLLNLSLNLDDVIDDPGDGGGISFQSTF